MPGHCSRSCLNALCDGVVMSEGSLDGQAIRNGKNGGYCILFVRNKTGSMEGERAMCGVRKYVDKKDFLWNACVMRDGHTARPGIAFCAALKKLCN